MNILAWIIKIIHIMVICFVVFAPFSEIGSVLILNITFCMCLLVHWLANNDICFLTMLEGKLRNIDYRQGFLHQFVSPIYNISNYTLSKICYLVVILSMSISLYNFFYSKTFANTKKCYDNNGSFVECLKVLLVV